MRIVPIAIALFSTMMTVYAGSNRLAEMAEALQAQSMRAREQAVSVAMREGLPIREQSPDGHIIELQKIVKGRAVYYATDNEHAAMTTHTRKLWSAPYNLTGEGYTHLGEWDGGAVRGTHDELTGRVTQMDGTETRSDHATHVAGTLIASGVKSAARGMASAADLSAYDWNDDASEMAAAADGGMEISNHSYGYIVGWYHHSNGDWDWYGDTSIDPHESYLFGFYDQQAHDWDDIAYHAPYYLIVKSAGNDRNDVAPKAGTPHRHNGEGSYTDTHYDDGYDHGGYDTISSAALAKNVLTVGAVDDIADYHTARDVHMSSFSGWGPTDDGRIKPDLVANGISLYSSLASSDHAYGYMSGTSMSAPNAAGTLVLLQEQYRHTHGGASMRAATLKGLVIHTADEAGESAGPDYQFGWGVLDALKAAETITEDTNLTTMEEGTLTAHATFRRDIVLKGGLETYKATLSWSDPAGTPVAPALDPPDPMLVRDLDLRVIHDGVVYYPWSLDRDHPGDPAVRTHPNHADTVEQVQIDHPEAGTYTVVVDHTGSLPSDQNFSLILDPMEAGTPALVYETYRIEDTGSSGNGNGIVNPGEALAAWVTLNNTGSESLHQVEANLSTSDACVAMPDTHLEWGTIPASHSQESTAFDFNVSATCPEGHSLTFHLAITATEGTWSQDFMIPVLGANAAPIAYAGSDQEHDVGEAVTLDGSGSYDPDGSIVSYLWTEGDTTLSTSATFTRSDFGVGQHTLTLTVTDNNGTTARDTVLISVYDPKDDRYEENDNQATAYDLRAYPDTWLHTINGYGKQYDADWYVIHLDAGTQVEVTARFRQEEGDIDLHFINEQGLEVARSAGYTDDESITYVVEKGGDYFIKLSYGNQGNRYDLKWTRLNVSPHADAGKDVTAGVGEPVILVGKGEDPDGTIVSYRWEEGTTTLSTDANMTKTDFSVGKHILTFTVTDDGNATASDTVTVTIKTTPYNTPPIAWAGEDRNVTLGEAVLFDGSESRDPDGYITSYLWKEGDTILSTAGMFVKKDFSVGAHTVTLTVTDNEGATGDKQVVIRVKEGSTETFPGGGCSYNPRSRGADGMVVLMIIVTLLYPVSRWVYRRNIGIKS